MTRVRMAIAACATLLWAGAALAAATPQQKCEVAKLKALGTLQACLKTNSGKLILGKADASATCQTKFTTAMAKADTKGECRYFDNGDGTVTDLNTGLMWEQKGNLDGTSNANDPHDADNSYSWSTGSPYNPDGTAFVGFVAALNGGVSSDGNSITGCFANHCDWRLPTIAELQAIVDPSQNPRIDPTFGATKAYYYWSATTWDGGDVGAWNVHFGTGSLSAGTKTGAIAVRAVRGGL